MANTDTKYSCWHCIHHDISRCELNRPGWPFHGGLICAAFEYNTQERGPFHGPLKEGDKENCGNDRSI